MKLIAHRGNIKGPQSGLENRPNYIDNTIELGYDVEVDVWYVGGKLFLGHDEPQYGVTIDYFIDRIAKLWIHCKDLESLEFFQNHENLQYTNYFWHQEDDVTLTSLNYIWTYPGKKLVSNSVAVMPELIPDWDLSNSFGVCSDYIENYK